MATQQRPGEKGRKVHKNLSQQGRHFLQSALQLGGDTVVGKKWEKDEGNRRDDKTDEIRTRKHSGDLQ